MPKRNHDHDCPRTLCICASGMEDEPEPDPTPCNHPAHAWRRCADCRAEYGDLQYQRMKEGER